MSRNVLVISSQQMILIECFQRKSYGFDCFVPISVINFPDLQLGEKTPFFRDPFLRRLCQKRNDGVYWIM